MQPKVAIIYYSSTGTTYKMARAVAEGAREAGAEVRLAKVREIAPEAAIQSNEKWAKHVENTREVREAQLADLEWADAIIFGTPTRYGGATSQLRAFIDTTGGLWFQGKLANKIGSSFTSTATPHGGQENTILSLNSVFYHWGALIVSPGYLDPIQFQMGNPYGVSFTSNNGEFDPDETALAASRFHGRRVAQITAQFLRGRGGEDAG
jgi:NAD(P)H dehydrogenase (quinone)